MLNWDLQFAVMHVAQIRSSLWFDLVKGDFLKRWAIPGFFFFIIIFTILLQLVEKT